MNAPIQPGRPDRPSVSGGDPFARRPGEDDAVYAARLRVLETELAARQTAARRSVPATPRPEGRRAITSLRPAGPIGLAARTMRDRRAQRDRRIGTADRRAGLTDPRQQADGVERRVSRRDRRLGTRDRRWLPERRHQAGLTLGGRAMGAPTSVVFATLFVLALLALAAVALF